MRRCGRTEPQRSLRKEKKILDLFLGLTFHFGILMFFIGMLKIPEVELVPSPSSEASGCVHVQILLFLHIFNELIHTHNGVFLRL